MTALRHKRNKALVAQTIRKADEFSNLTFSINKRPISYPCNWTVTIADNQLGEISNRDGHSTGTLELQGGTKLLHTLTHCLLRGLRWLTPSVMCQSHGFMCDGHQLINAY